MLAGWLGTRHFDARGAWIEARRPDLSIAWRDEVPSDGAPLLAADVAADHAVLVVGEPVDDAAITLRARVHDADGTLLCDDVLGTRDAGDGLHAALAPDGALWLVVYGRGDSVVAHFVTEELG